MKTREKHKIELWKSLRSGKSPTYLDILKYQSNSFYLMLLAIILVGIYNILNFGVLSAPAGVIYGAIAVFMGFIESKRKNLKIEVKYLDWSKIDSNNE